VKNPRMAWRHNEFAAIPSSSHSPTAANPRIAPQIINMAI